MDPRDFYVSYHVSQMQTPLSEDTTNFAINKPLWPSTEGAAFAVPNSVPSEYNTPVPRTDIINSTERREGPAQIYSGIEPLASLDRPELTRHFQDTTLPKTALLLDGRRIRNADVFVSPSSHVKEQKELLRQMEASMQKHMQSSQRSYQP